MAVFNDACIGCSEAAYSEVAPYRHRLLEGCQPESAGQAPHKRFMTKQGGALSRTPPHKHPAVPKHKPLRSNVSGLLLLLLLGTVIRPIAPVSPVGFAVGTT